MALSFWTRNFYKCLVNIIELPYILCAVASLHVQSIRRFVYTHILNIEYNLNHPNEFKWFFFSTSNSDLVERFSVAYQNKVLTVPLDWLKRIMQYDSWQQLSTDLKYYGFVPDTQEQCVRFQRDSFLSSKPIVSSEF